MVFFFLPYYRVERDCSGELCMRGLVWVDRSSVGGVECVGKAVRDCMSGVCEQGGADSVGQGGGGWMWYNKVKWVGFRITIKVSY